MYYIFLGVLIVFFCYGLASLLGLLAQGSKNAVQNINKYPTTGPNHTQNQSDINTPRKSVLSVSTNLATLFSSLFHQDLEYQVISDDSAESAINWVMQVSANSSTAKVDQQIEMSFAYHYEASKQAYYCTERLSYYSNNQVQSYLHPYEYEIKFFQPHADNSQDQYNQIEKLVRFVRLATIPLDCQNLSLVQLHQMLLNSVSLYAAIDRKISLFENQWISTQEEGWTIFGQNGKPSEYHHAQTLIFSRDGKNETLINIYQQDATEPCKLYATIRFISKSDS